jgi:hypothetical protein
MVGAM